MINTKDILDITVEEWQLILSRIMGEAQDIVGGLPGPEFM